MSKYLELKIMKNTIIKKSLATTKTYIAYSDMVKNLVSEENQQAQNKVNNVFPLQN